MISAQFPCTMCGACCRSIGTVLEQRGSAGRFQVEIDSFPFKATEDGSCEKLTDKGCSVYADRPDLCNTETMRKRHYPEMSKAEYFKAGVAACSVLIDRMNIDPSLKPKYQ